MRTLSLRLSLLSAAVLFFGCPTPKQECSINTDCAVGQMCTANKCVSGSTGGGTGGGVTGGGTGGGVTGGGTGGGVTGGGTGGGVTGGGTGGGMTGGGTGGGVTGGGTGGGATGGGGGATGGGGGTTGGGGGTTGGGGGTTGGGGGTTGGGGGTTGGGGGTTGGGGGATDGGNTSLYASETCTMVNTISSNLTLLNESLVGVINDYQWTGQPGCTPSGTFGPELTYSLTIPPGQRVTVTATPKSAFDVSIQFATTCTLGMVNTCLAGGNAAAEGLPEVLSFTNPGMTPFNVFLIIDTLPPPPDPSTFDLSIVFGTVPPGETCGTAITPDAGTVNGTLVGFVNDYFAGAACAAASNGPDVVWMTSVPPGNRLTSTVTASATGTGFGFEPTVNLVTGTCAPTLTCVAGAASGAGLGTATATWDNVGTSAVPVMVVVDTATSSPTGTYTLTNNVAPFILPAGDVCGNTGAPITVDTMLTAQSLVGYGSNYTTGTAELGCAFANGPDRVYAVTVAANTRLTLLANSTTADLAISVVDGPAAACLANPLVCGASADTNFSTGTETLRFDNNATVARTVFVIIDRAPGTLTTDAFDLGISLAPPPYAKTTIPQTCQVMTGGTPLLGSGTSPVISDDGVSTTAALPFAFSFFGVAQTHYAVTNNGLLQFFTSAAGAGSSAFGNAPIPSIATPNGFAAPFWDDLYFVGTTVIQTLTTGTAPNRKMTVEWFDSTFFPSGRPERLQFQAQVYETTNVIEFHYCSLVAGTGSAATTTGGSATIGLESPTGAEGVQHSNNVASSVSTANALRFTP